VVKTQERYEVVDCTKTLEQNPGRRRDSVPSLHNLSRNLHLYDLWSTMLLSVLFVGM
jgi:hypothetical protein